MKAAKAPPPPRGPEGSDALCGARVYGSVLHRAGGSEVEALANDRHRAGLCVALYKSPPYDLEVPALAVSRLSVTLTAARVFGGLHGDRPRAHDTARHALFLTPAGAAAHWRKDSPSRHLTLYFHPESFEGDALGADPCLTAPLTNAPLGALRGLVEALQSELDSGAVHAAEAADSLGRLLLVRLARRLRDEQRPHRLPPASLMRLRDYVRAHLSDRILVADLAGVVGLSPTHFAHLFSAQMGMPPHRFVMELRLARALELLAGATLSLAEVAAACGFASQQHLTAQMRQRMGTTPGRYRRSRRGEPEGRRCP